MHSPRVLQPTLTYEIDVKRIKDGAKRFRSLSPNLTPKEALEAVHAQAVHVRGVDAVVPLEMCQPRDWSETTLEELIEIARPFDGRTAFQKGDGGACSVARQRGWLDDIAAALGWKSRQRDWSEATLEDMIEIARPFDGRKAFEKGDTGAYRAAYYRNWLADIAAALGWEPKRRGWSDATLEDLIEVARSHDGRSAFAQADSGAYYIARRRGWLNDIAAALGWPKNKSHKS